MVDGCNNCNIPTSQICGRLASSRKVLSEGCWHVGRALSVWQRPTRHVALCTANPGASTAHITRATRRITEGCLSALCDSLTHSVARCAFHIALRPLCAPQIVRRGALRLDCRRALNHSCCARPTAKSASAAALGTSTPNFRAVRARMAATRAPMSSR